MLYYIAFCEFCLVKCSVMLSLFAPSLGAFTTKRKYYFPKNHENLKSYTLLFVMAHNELSSKKIVVLD